ncbi:MAG: hypothetical protein JWN77_975 [Frankiales bacterium]|nr:hypothetical protein [Frankiales bacterium]
MLRGRTAAVGLLLGLVAACGGGSAEEPQTLPPVSTAPSPSASPSASGVVTAAEVEAAVAAYYKAINQALAAADESLFMAMVEPSCSCYEPAVTKLRELKREGQTVTYDAHATDVRPHELSSTGGQAFVTYVASDSPIKDSAGNVVGTLPGQKPYAQDLIFLKREDGLKLVNVVNLGQ